MSWWIRSLVAVACTLALGCGALGCGSTMTRDDSIPDLRWPSPPVPARIALEPPFVALRVPTGFFGRIGRLFMGSPDAIAIDRPVGIAIAPEGRLAIVDQGANRVYSVDQDGTIERDLDLGRAGIQEAVDVAVSPDGEFYVSDPRRGRVVRFDRKGKHTDSISIDGRPTSLVWDPRSGELVIVDTTTPQVLAYDPVQGTTRELAPAVAGGTILNRPVWIGLAGEGGYWIVDALNFRICRLDTDGAWQGCFGEGGDGPGSFSRPRGVVEDEDGHIHIVDALFGNCQIFDRQGTLLLAYGAGGSGAGELLLPSDIAVDGDLIFVADSYNHRVQVFRKLPPPSATEEPAEVGEEIRR